MGLSLGKREKTAFYDILKNDYFIQEEQYFSAELEKRVFRAGGDH